MVVFPVILPVLLFVFVVIFPAVLLEFFLVLLVICSAFGIFFFTMEFVILLRILSLLLSVISGINALPSVDHFPVLLTVLFHVLPVLFVSESSLCQ